MLSAANIVMNFSFIIPHKNIPDLLQRCLDSIPTREDTEIIIVDDNSDESVVDFSNFPGKGMPNTICIFTKEGKGAGYARNIGMERARGKWIVFIDSDDFLYEAANDILDRHIDCKADVILFKSESRLSSDLSILGNRSDEFNAKIDKCLVGALEKRTTLLGIETPWPKIVSREFLINNSIYFDETHCANDAFWSVKCAVCAQQIEVSSDCFYVVTYREKSLSTTYDENSLFTRYGVKLKCSRYLVENGYHQYKQPIAIEYLPWARRISLICYFKFIHIAIKDKSIWRCPNMQVFNYRFPLFYIFYLLFKG